MATRWLKASYWKNVSDPPIKTSTGTELFYSVFKREATQRNLLEVATSYDSSLFSSSVLRSDTIQGMVRSYYGPFKMFTHHSLRTHEWWKRMRILLNAWLQQIRTQYCIYQVRYILYILCRRIICTVLQNLKPVRSWHRQVRTYWSTRY